MMFNQPVKLNDYQQLMLRINQLSPYNAVHVVLMAEQQVDLIVLNQSINKVLQQLSLGIPEFSSHHQQVLYHPLHESLQLETRFMPLESHVQYEMNYHFAINEFPLRFFIIDDQSKLYFSISYNHWIGDAYSIYRLMECILSDWKERTHPPLMIANLKIEDCFPQIYQRKITYYRYLGVLQNFIQFSRAYRTQLKDETSLESDCCFYFFEKEIVATLQQFCRKKGMTVNDLFIIILARLFGEMSQIERKNIKHKWFKPKRDRIIIAIVSNIRDSSLQPLKHAFGVFLGFFYLSFKSPETMSFQALCQLVRTKTTQAKRKHLAIKQYLLFDIQNKIWDRLVQKRSQYRIFNKNTPITVGISNMNLSRNNLSTLPGVEEYIRFSPSAMVCPIVFNMTTFNDHLSLGINYRKTSYTLEQVVHIKNQFVMALNQLSV